MEDFIKNYFDAFFSRDNLGRVYVEPETPKEMMASDVDDEGWYKWKPLPGSLTYEQYTETENKFGVKFPRSFIEWHKAWFFLDGRVTILKNCWQRMGMMLIN